MAFTNIYDVTQPPDTQAANLLGLDLRNLALNVQQRMAAISGLDAAKPAFGSDTQPANWNGILYFATDTGKIYQFNNPSWTQIGTLGNSITTSVDLTAQTVGIPLTTLMTPSVAGSYFVIFNLLLNTIGSVNYEFALRWTQNGIACTNPNTEWSVTSQQAVTGNYLVYSDASEPIQYSVGASRVGGGLVNFDVHIRVLSLG